MTADVPGSVRRDIEVTNDQVRITDLVLDRNVAAAQVTWLVDSICCNPKISVEEGDAESLIATEGDVTAWYSPTYGLRLPLTALRVRRERTADLLRIETVIRCAC